MASLDEAVRSGDLAKELIVSEEIEADIERTISEQSSDNLNTAVTLESEKRRHQKEDESFWEIYNILSTKVTNCLKNEGNEMLLNLVKELCANQKMLKVKDHLQRSLLHIAVEKGNNVLAKTLVNAGFDINCKEGCGLTPLHFSILSGNNMLCSFLTSEDAKMMVLCFQLCHHQWRWHKP